MRGPNFSTILFDMHNNGRSWSCAQTLTLSGFISLVFFLPSTSSRTNNDLSKLYGLFWITRSFPFRSKKQKKKRLSPMTVIWSPLDSFHTFIITIFRASHFAFLVARILPTKQFAIMSCTSLRSDLSTTDTSSSAKENLNHLHRSVISSIKRMRSQT